MAISSINISMGASYGAYNQKLTQETKAKLQELGINFNPNITEQEGKMLLKKAQDLNNHNNGNDLKNNNKQKDNSLFLRAEKLARKLGVGVDENIGLTQLLSKIENALKEKINLNQNDIEVLKQLKVLSQELNSLQAETGQTQGYSSTNEALMKSLEVLSLYNQNFLHK